jgi:hypothetical protein
MIIIVFFIHQLVMKMGGLNMKVAFANGSGACELRTANCVAAVTNWGAE